MPIASCKLHEEKDLTELNGEIDKSTFMFGNFSIFQKFTEIVNKNQGIEDLVNTFSHLNVFNIYRTTTSNNCSIHLLFKYTWYIATKVDHINGLSVSLRKFLEMKSQ